MINNSLNNYYIKEVRVVWKGGGVAKRKWPSEKTGAAALPCHPPENAPPRIESMALNIKLINNLKGTLLWPNRFFLILIPYVGRHNSKTPHVFRNPDFDLKPAQILENVPSPVLAKSPTGIGKIAYRYKPNRLRVFAKSPTGIGHIVPVLTSLTIHTYKLCISLLPKF